jgi:hypothetical protein
LILLDALGRLPDGPESSKTREWLSGVVQVIAQPNGLTDAEMLDIVDHLVVLPPAAG